MTLICTWLVEIYLDLINKADDDKDPEAAAAGDSAALPVDVVTPSGHVDHRLHVPVTESAARRLAVIKSFRSFLKDNNEHLEAATTNNLLSSHGRMAELLYFAELRADYE